MAAFNNTDTGVLVHVDIFTLTEGFLVEKPRYQPKGNTHPLFKHRKSFKGTLHPSALSFVSLETKSYF